MSIVTRFPPSPTGFMHIGTARTALFNWLYARKNGGKMLFRIEDTDRARHNEEAVVALINAMKWLELDWDGEIVSQYEQKNRHIEIAEELLDKGLAYRCYCSQDELEEMRKKAREDGKPTFYDRRWRDKGHEDAPKGIEPTIRIKAPREGKSTIQDHVQGEVTVNNTQLDDFIILRADGTPTYMLSVVVDDHDMGVTHVIRGDDHLNNTFRQNVIYDVLGWEKPQYAHLPLILGPDGTKMSKRHGAASVEEYREMGYLPEAMRNYLLRLGWSHGDDEIISDTQALEWFNLDHIGKAAARFDFDKLESLNAHYINESDPQRLIELCMPFYKQRHNIDPDAQAQMRIMQSADELKSRAKTLLQFTDESAFYAKTAPFDYDEKAGALLGQDNLDVLQALKTTLESLSDFTSENIQSAIKTIAADLRESKMGKVAMPLRAALTGTTVSPSIFHATEILGKTETCARIQNAIDRA
ncbi:MAG TPA: glutamate--tRNA ligase [Alphaproteobacteria bacterium]|nr:glutamate--tRNA ligase [Alphaproteobacteria bacterium]USO06148.1 MAG: glutamate--tRNA ligase [Rhodospirillales bacterium]HOO82519.1 glutamate--tRNA ligase [Alphaproteobacteria bacterium]